GGRSSRSSESGSTVSFSGADSDPGAVMCAMRPSVAAIAGWPSGYKSTARAAALHARAKSINRAFSSGASGRGHSTAIRTLAPGVPAKYTARTAVRAVDIITSKRDGRALSRDEIRFFVAGVTEGTLPDYQASALLMAILLRGMDAEETAWLTDAMVH